ncbi:MAG: hypothetical protein KKE12_13300 [Proteobacteria bacterium]|nr:hypothetical protein [Pseudomonadota bacterium]
MRESAHHSGAGKISKAYSCCWRTGQTDISKAFEQLRYTRDERLEYKQIIALFSQQETKNVVERFVIVSNAQISKVEREKLENAHNIRVRKILHCEATTPVPDLKELI